jgi:hypothetical protein
VAVVPLNLTDDAPVRLVPVITTVAPTAPEAGANEVTVGVGRTVNVAALATVTPALVTEMVPLVAPAGTVAVIWVAELTM